MALARPWRTGDIADYGGELHIVLKPESRPGSFLVVESINSGVKHRVYMDWIGRPTKRQLQRAHRRTSKLAAGFKQWALHIDIELKRRS